MVGVYSKTEEENSTKCLKLSPLGTMSQVWMVFEIEIRLATDWQINLTGSHDRVKLFYISQCYDRPVPQFMPKCHRVHIEREGQCEQGKLENA